MSRFVIAPRGIQPLAVYAVLDDDARLWVEGIGPWFRFAKASPELEGVVRKMNRMMKGIQARSSVE